MDRKGLRRSRTERVRGMIVNFLYVQRPAPLEVVVLRKLLDRFDYPMTWRMLGVELDFLRALGLVRIFELGESKELDDVTQAKLIQRYVDMDGEGAECLAARLTALGVNFAEGVMEQPGVERVG